MKNAFHERLKKFSVPNAPQIDLVMSFFMSAKVVVNMAFDPSKVKTGYHLTNLFPYRSAEIVKVSNDIGSSTVNTKFVNAMATGSYLHRLLAEDVKKH